MLHYKREVIIQENWSFNEKVLLEGDPRPSNETCFPKKKAPKIDDDDADDDNDNDGDEKNSPKKIQKFPKNYPQNWPKIF